MKVLHEWLGGSKVIDLEANEDIYGLYQVLGAPTTAEVLATFYDGRFYNLVVQVNPTDLTTVHQFTVVSDDFEG